MRNSASRPTLAKEVVIYEDDIQHSGFLRKQSKVLKIWRKRWCVLTSQYLSSFKYEGDYRTPTEVIALTNCISVKSAEKETRRENSLSVVTKDRIFFLVANSADEKEQWTAAIMNAVLPALNSRGLRRSLSLFSIEERDYADEDEDCAFVTSPKKWLSSLLTPRSQSQSPPKSWSQSPPMSWGPPSPAGGKRRNSITRAGFQVPSLDASLIDMPGFCCTPSSNGSSSAKTSSNGSTGAIPQTPTSTKISLPEDCLLAVWDDQVLISPKVLPSLLRSTPRARTREICFFLDAAETHIKEMALIDFEELRQEEGFQVGEMVLARDYEVQAWVSGVVSCADPLKVQPKGKSRGHSFQYVQRMVSRQPQGHAIVSTPASLFLSRLGRCFSNLFAYGFKDERLLHCYGSFSEFE